ncbi:MAG: deoxynucleoside kinase [Anaerolineales bacterium]
MKRYITVAGNIGAGKSTLVGLLCDRMGWQPFYEPVAENPYLADFYKDMRTWGFHSQVYFLIHRLRTHRQLIDHPTSVIQDRSVYEDAEVFALNLYRQGFIRERDFKTYRDLYSVLTTFLPPPDLVIYLRASVKVLMEHIKQRNRVYERNITPDYLAQLNELYEKWVTSFNLCPLLTVPVDNLNYVTHPPHLNLIVKKVGEKLTGKEEVTFSEDEVTASL